MFFLYGKLVNSQPPSSWQYTNTGDNHTIVIQANINPTINGVALDTGTYIGVFFDAGDSLKCAGYVKWEGISTSLAAWGNDGTIPPLGFAVGEEFKFKVWLNDSCTIDNVKVTYSFDSLFSHTGNYANNGISGLASLEGNGCNSTGIHVGGLIKKLSIYPNPFKDFIHLDILANRPTSAEIRLIDIQGQLVYSKESRINAGQNSLMIHPKIWLPEGLYFLDLVKEGTGTCTKVLRK